MIEPSWPSPAELCVAVAERLEEVLQATPDVMREVFRSIMSSEDRVLSATPRPQSSLLVAAAAVSAGGTWQTALSPAVAAECVMAAADVFDDIADGGATELDTRFGPGVARPGGGANAHGAPRRPGRARQHSRRRLDFPHRVTARARLGH